MELTTCSEPGEGCSLNFLTVGNNNFRHKTLKGFCAAELSPSANVETFDHESKETSETISNEMNETRKHAVKGTDTPHKSFTF